MPETRHKNVNWNLGSIVGSPSWNQVQIALLMDIRDELQTLNRLLGCQNFIRIPRVLDSIAANTKPKRKYTRRTPLK